MFSPSTLFFTEKISLSISPKSDSLFSLQFTTKNLSVKHILVIVAILYRLIIGFYKTLYDKVDSCKLFLVRK